MRKVVGYYLQELPESRRLLPLRQKNFTGMLHTQIDDQLKEKKKICERSLALQQSESAHSGGISPTPLDIWLRVQTLLGLADIFRDTVGCEFPLLSIRSEIVCPHGGGCRCPVVHPLLLLLLCHLAPLHAVKACALVIIKFLKVCAQPILRCLPTFPIQHPGPMLLVGGNATGELSLDLQHVLLPLPHHPPLEPLGANRFTAPLPELPF